MVSASCALRKSSNCSACEPRAPRWTSEINKVRKRRSGLSSLIESLPMDAHLTDSHDRAMTTEAVHGTANADPAGTRISPHSRLIANSSATRQSGDAIVIAAQTVAVNHGQRLLGGTIARSRGAARPSCCLRSPLKERAQGKPGARRTRSLARNKKAHERSHHRFAETIRPSLRDGLRLIPALSLVTGLSCHHRLRIAPPT